MVVPLKGHPGVTMRRLNVAGQKTGGTTYIELDDVAVPVSNLIGREGEGMRIIMTNFNHERLIIAVGVTRQSRVALSAAFQYTLKREAFGKTLMDQPVVRHRLAKAGAELETMHAWVEQILYQLSHMSKEEGDRRLGGITALAKAKAAMVLNECAQCAVLLFGGNGFTAAGQGELVEGESTFTFYAQLMIVANIHTKQSTAMCPGRGFPGDRRMSCWTWRCVSWSRCTRLRRRSWDNQRFDLIDCVLFFVSPCFHSPLPQKCRSNDQPLYERENDVHEINRINSHSPDDSSKTTPRRSTTAAQAFHHINAAFTGLLAQETAAHGRDTGRVSTRSVPFSRPISKIRIVLY